MNLNIATGIKALDLTGVDTARVSFNPTDMNFIERLYHAFDALDKKNEDRKKRIPTMENVEAFEYGRTVDSEMRQTIDGIFGEGVCKALFGDMNMYAMADGAPLWENFMFTIIEQCDDAMAAERLKENPRVKKYMDKYKKK